MSCFQSLPFFTFRPNFEELESSLIDDFTMEAQADGPSTPWKVSAGPRRKLKYPFLFYTADELKQLRVFIGQVQGKKLAMWVPNWFSDYRVVSNAIAGASTITVEKTGLATNFGLFTNYKALAIVTADTLDPYLITSVATVGATEVITLTTPLVRDLVAEQSFACGLLFARFSGDEFEFDYENDEVAKIELGWVECPTEYADPLQGSTPQFLYKLTRGSTIFYLCNWQVDLVTTDMVPITYTAADISHQGLKANTEMIGSELDLIVSTDDPAHPLRYFLARTATEITELEIRYFDADFGIPFTTANTTLLYKGRIGQVTFEKQGVIRSTCSSAFRLSEQSMPAKKTQRTCAHQTYDAGCGLVEATFTTTTTVGAITDDYVQATAFATKATLEADPNWFALGKVYIGQQVRLCVGQVTDKLYLNAPFNGTITPGTVVSASAGDDKRIGTCQQKFNNVDRFLGYPYMPQEKAQFEELITPQQGGGKKG